jgi:hypothetical protein
VKILYFLSSTHPYETVIYPGVGPRYAKTFGWPTLFLDQLSEAECDIGIIDNRLTPSDYGLIDAFLARSKKRFPVFFKLSDPDMPTYADQTKQFALAKKDFDGVHYLSIYDPAGPLQDFIAALKRSKVFRLPYAYDRSQEVERGFESRRRKVFLSGADSATLYPLRGRMHWRMKTNPLMWFTVTVLKHPGYPEFDPAPRHNIMFERYVEYASQFTHFFLCPSRYRVELMKYVECAYAGCVPIGEPPLSLDEATRHCFIPNAANPVALMREALSDKGEMAARAGVYRDVMRKLRDPGRLERELKNRIAAAL